MNPESVHQPTGTPFSILAIRDRVVIMLLFDQIVQEEHVEKAWQLWHEMAEEGVKEPLWRVLTLFPEVDSEMVYAEAARVYGFEEARVTRGTAVSLIQQAHRRFDEETWKKMVDLRLLPIREIEQRHSHHQRTVYATHDPARNDVQELLRTTEEVGYELRYVHEALLLDLLAEAFPGERRYQQLRTAASALPSDVGNHLELSVSVGEEHIFSEGGTASTAGATSSKLQDGVQGSLIESFENVLIEAVERHATDICLLPNAQGHMEVYFQVHKQLKRWKVIDDVSANALLSVIKREILGIRGENKSTKKHVIRRWIQDEPVQFRVTALPPGDDLHSESIVIRVLQ